MRIVVLDGYTLNPGDNPWDDLAALGNLVVHDRTPPDRVFERSRGAAVLVTNKVVLDADGLSRLTELQFIAVTATGYNVVDVEAAADRGIPVSNVPVYGTASVAQFTFALLLELCNRVGLHADAVRRGEWSRCPDFSLSVAPQIELAGRCMGIIGFGRIGRRVGELAHAFGMQVIAADRRPGEPPGYEPFSWVSVDDLFRQADVVSLHCPLTEQNRALVCRRTLALMKPTAFLINTARGGLVDPADLAEALNTGRIAGAALDVVDVEPIPPGHPLLGCERCLITPHVAWCALAARRRLMAATVENVRAFLDGRPTNVVNERQLKQRGLWRW